MTQGESERTEWLDDQLRRRTEWLDDQVSQRTEWLDDQGESEDRMVR